MSAAELSLLSDMLRQSYAECAKLQQERASWARLVDMLRAELRMTRSDHLRAINALNDLASSAASMAKIHGEWNRHPEYLTEEAERLIEDLLLSKSVAQQDREKHQNKGQKC